MINILIFILILILAFILIFCFFKKELFNNEICNICSNETLNNKCSNFTFYKCKDNDGSVNFKIPDDNLELFIIRQKINKNQNNEITIIKKGTNGLEIISQNKQDKIKEIIKKNTNTYKIIPPNNYDDTFLYTLNWIDNKFYTNKNIIIKTSETIKLSKKKDNNDTITYPNISDIIYSNLQNKKFYINI